MLSQVSRRALSVRSFSTSRIAFAAPPSGGKDSFREKENAEEAAYVRKHEAEQLAKLREELAKQKTKIAELEESINKK
ncbi:ATPase-stabilizing factor 9 kDa, mitochondrial [[Candida] railenensis]|uniref:ATPase inhibitor, mitochondrial n=1 Tax=[Candida] railenensis TaxID=45579 RepID=A0A9P0QQM3_9ASCO|nr:ATPase-stabilizing factor 9 kDa, mitochondrial [[Candida] railenensis]